MTFIESLRRPDWLDELRVLLLLATLATGLGAAAAVVATLTGRSLHVEVAGQAALSPGALVGAPPGVGLADALTLEVATPTTAQLGWSLLSALPSFALLTATLALLWRAVARACREDPFRSGLAGRLHSIGFLLIGGGLLAWVVESLARFALSGTVGVGGMYMALDFTVAAVWVFSGMAMFAVGEIVRRGQAMRTELDQVV